MLMWIAIGAVVVGLIILVAVTLPVIRRLSGLRRAAGKLQRRQDEAMALQAGVVQLERTVLQVQKRAEAMQEGIALIKAGHGDGLGKRALPGRH